MSLILLILELTETIIMVLKSRISHLSICYMYEVANISLLVMIEISDTTLLYTKQFSFSFIRDVRLSGINFMTLILCVSTTSF